MSCMCSHTADGERHIDMLGHALINAGRHAEAYAQVHLGSVGLAHALEGRSNQLSETNATTDGRDHCRNHSEFCIQSDGPKA